MKLRCADVEMLRQELEIQEPCACADPELSESWFDNPLWADKHRLLVEQAENTGKVDLVLLGDSITERMNGRTHFPSQPQMPDNLEIFRSILTRSGGGSMDALALGVSGDTSPNLLWHLENGMLPDSLNPKVWLILIGTNDLGRTLCNKEAVLKGIRQVTRTLRARRPLATLIVHGLLPRSDMSMAKPMEDENYKTGYYWEQIKWINEQLNQTCSTDVSIDCLYMETVDIFLDHGGERIDKETMTDGLHPSSKGYKQWLPLLSARVRQLLQKSM